MAGTTQETSLKSRNVFSVVSRQVTKDEKSQKCILDEYAHRTLLFYPPTVSHQTWDGFPDASL